MGEPSTAADARLSAARRGRRPRQTREGIVRSAVDLADAEGLSAVSMRAVATRLGTGVMSLYTYVPDKKGLVAAMVAAIAREQRFPEPTGDWRADLHTLSHEQRRLLLRHPWATEALTQALPISGDFLPSFEYGLAALEPLRLDSTTAMETLGLLAGVVVNLVRAELAASGSAVANAAADEPDDGLADALSSGRFPRFAAAVTARPPAPRLDVATAFDRLLDRVLDGLIPSAQAGG